MSFWQRTNTILKGELSRRERWRTWITTWVILSNITTVIQTPGINKKNMFFFSSTWLFPDCCCTFGYGQELQSSMTCTVKTPVIELEHWGRWRETCVCCTHQIENAILYDIDTVIWLEWKRISAQSAWAMSSGIKQLQTGTVCKNTRTDRLREKRVMRRELIYGKTDMVAKKPCEQVREWKRNGEIKEGDGRQVEGRGMK